MKIRIYIAFLYCLFGASCSFFQPESPNPERFYIKMFGGQREQQGVAVEVLTSERAFILGHTNSFTNDFSFEMYLIEINEEGNEVWNRSYPGVDKAVGLVLTEDKQHLLLVGNRTVTGTSKIKVIKTDLQGSAIWTKELNSGNDISYTASNISIVNGETSCLIIGTSEALITGTTDQFLKRIYAVELDENGTVLWEKNYNLTDRKEESGVAIQAYNNNVIIVGESVSVNGSIRPIVIEAKRNSVGEELQSEILFKETLLSEQAIVPKDMLQTTSGDFVILCQGNNKTGVIEMTVSSEDRITPKLPNFLAANFQPFGFSETSNGELLITGQIDEQIGLTRISLTGIPVWEERFGEKNRFNIGMDVSEKSDGTILTIGTLNFSNNQMIGVIKTTAEGKLE